MNERIEEREREGVFIFTKNGCSQPLFLYFRLFDPVFIQLIVNKIANGWIRAAAL